MNIVGNMVGCYSPMGKTFIIADENGNEITGVCVDEEVVFTATADDIKIGKIAATDEGIVEGTDTKTYRTTQASCLILPGMDFSIPLDKYNIYDYTKFQCIIAKFNTSAVDSIETNRIAINNKVYPVNSVNEISQITKNENTKSVDLNIINNTDEFYMIHYMVYKEE